jgi:hypothetical protein
VILKPVLKPVLKPGDGHNVSITSNKADKKELIMKSLAFSISKNIRVILFVATLVLFVLAAGAPSATGPIGG